MIEKITDQNLERYDSRLKEWCDRKFFKKGNYGKYQTTEESGAVSFYPAPNTPLEGKVKFSFKETMPASGDKGLNNPSAIIGVSSVKVTRCRKNLIPYPYPDTTKTDNGITWTDNGDGSVTANGTATADTYFYLVYSGNNNIQKIGKTYTISGCPSGGSLSTYCIRFGNSGYTEVGNGYTFVANNNTIGKTISLKIGSGTTVSNLVFKPQLELDSIVTVFELYEGTDYTISLGDTYYGGEIDLVTGVMTVTHLIKSLTGSERISSSATAQGTTRVEYSTFAVGDDLPVNPSVASQTSTHLAFSTSPSFDFEHFFIDSTGRLKIFLNVSSEEDALAWLVSQNTAGTPFSVVYPLTNPYTVQLTFQQIFSLTQINKYAPRLNIVYTDADSIQIFYLKSPIRDEYEKTQAILSLGGNS